MGLFKRKEKAVSPEELAAKEENLRMLEQFQVTKAWGIKRYPTAMQFIYDETHRWFTVAEGPEETFREREPYVIRFDQADSVAVEVDEYWSESGERYAPRGIGILTNTDPEGVSGKLVKSFYDEKMLKKIDNLLSHARRGERIRRLLEV